MDLNELLYRHQISLMRADAASCVSSRASHNGLARGYADRIEQLRDISVEGGAPLLLAA